MSFLHKMTSRRCFGGSLLASAAAAPVASLFVSRGVRAQGRRQQPPPGGAAAARQHARPVDAMNEFLNGFHFYADDMGRQVEATHYCTHLTEDFHQCVIFSSEQTDAKLIGIEYIVTERVFQSLPDEEKKLWHSHHYEVKSGELVAPGIPSPAEHAFMSAVITTYGKTWHTWQIDRDPNLPLGIPQLMMGFTADGQANQQLVRDRDRRLGLSSEKLRKNREDIKIPTVIAGANAWQSGKVMQLSLIEVPVRNRRA